MTEVEAAVSPIIETRGLVKRFGGTVALDHVDFAVRRGEVHALLGENGAGKSTLIKILAGVHRPDGGEILLHGAVHPVGRALPAAFIHQDLGLIETMTVMENIALVSRFPRRGGLIAWRRVRDRAREVLDTMSVSTDVEVPVSLLSQADRSLVAIARALVLDVDLLVLDEPTATLPESDVSRLFEVLERLRERGLGIIYVSHRLDEIFRVADRVTVLRDGARVATAAVGETTGPELVKMIVGQEPSKVFRHAPAPSASPLVELDAVETRGVGPVSFDVAPGEMVGLVGLRGAGQTEIGRVLFGAGRRDAGEIRLDGKALRMRGPLDAMREGIGFVSGQRAEESLAPTLTVRENLLLNPVPRGGSIVRPIRPRAERRRTLSLIERLNVRPRESERIIATLSGGNQQKVVLARWLEAGARVLVLEEPTFGVDVGAKAEIYSLLAQLLEEGNAIVLVSSDFEEVAGVCHRALVFSRGRVIDELIGDDLTIERLTERAGSTASVS
jgi:ribose transport system ATP-binding protein